MRRAAGLLSVISCITGMRVVVASERTSVQLDAISSIPLYRGAVAPFTEEGATEKVVSQELWATSGQVIAALRRPQ